MSVTYAVQGIQCCDGDSTYLTQLNADKAVNSR